MFKYAPAMEYGNERRARIFKQVCEVLGAVAFIAALSAMCFIGCIAFD